MRPEDLYDVVWASDPRLSPDGKTVAYAVNSVDREENAYRSAIWLAAVDGSSPPRQLTAGKKADGMPRWSPDGTRIAFASNRDGDQKQLYVLPLDGGEPLCLTDLKEDVERPAWSPDGTRIAFAARVPDPAYEEKDEKKRLPRRFTRHRYKLDSVGWTGDRRTHIFVVPADGSADAQQLTDGDFENEAPSWSPDSKQIAFASARDDDWDVQLRQQIWVVDAAGGEPRRVTPDDDYYDLPSWSPDGSSIACTWTEGGFDRPRHDRIAVVDVATGERRVLTEELDLQCGPFPAVREPLWDGDSLIFAVEEHGNTHVRRVPAAGGAVEEVGLRRPLGLRDGRRGRRGRPCDVDADDAERDLRRRPQADRGEHAVLRAGALAAIRALRGRLAGRRGGGGVARAAARRRGRPALSAPAQHPRRAVHAVREQVLRRVPGVRAGGLRRRLLEPARVVRVLGGVGSRHPRARRRRRRLGLGSTTRT